MNIFFKYLLQKVNKNSETRERINFYGELVFLEVKQGCTNRKTHSFAILNKFMNSF